MLIICLDKCHILTRSLPKVALALQPGQLSQGSVSSSIFEPCQDRLTFNLHSLPYLYQVLHTCGKAGRFARERSDGSTIRQQLVPHQHDFDK